MDVIDRGALHDLAAWAGVAVSGSETDAELFARVQASDPAPFEELSTRGLRLLAQLRGLPEAEHADRDEIMRALKRARGWRGAWREQRRRVVGTLLSRALPNVSAPGPSGAVADEDAERLRRRIQREGVVAGIAGELRGAADDYIAHKLDEIEARVDRKLAEIDAKLSAWREREIAARVRVLKLTLIVTILVAVISLGYDWAHWAAARTDAPPARVEEPQR
ncbi:MAG TPA: hypothetical protein P5572_09925 [Phycisphaerae bacterium]|nr:hypothetical protein [Phycisphaerales bacterium]HRX85323.1 hypothetical protein [Phycisphaerae bacterium]